MDNRERVRQSKTTWVLGALEQLKTAGIESVKIVPLAKQLKVTSGSFYWHFKNRRELHEAILKYWEIEMTDVAIVRARSFTDDPKQRIWKLMEQVMETGLAAYDLAIWHWAQSDRGAMKVFRRAIEKRFRFAKWMFEQAGFSEAEAESRGRLMVVYMMGESTLVPDVHKKRRKLLKQKFRILTNS